MRYTAGEPPIGVRTCWCRFCQYMAAGSATVNAIFRSDAVTITGKLATCERTADSGNRLLSDFCPKCGTPITSRAEVRPHLVVLRAGTFDDPGLAAPETTIWTGQAPDWALIHPGLPRFDRQPPPVA